MTTRFAIAAALAAGLAFPASGFATGSLDASLASADAMGGAGGSTGGAEAGSGSLTANQVQGIVDSVDAGRRRLTIRDDQGNLVSYDLAADAAITSLSNGDSVTLSVAEGDPTRADAVRVNTPQ